ncbi:hypothetical protein PIB30_091299, partial [Stylosanthes scabra]|nr:hypothetical protein [Stylosanthes scabra]
RQNTGYLSSGMAPSPTYLGARIVIRERRSEYAVFSDSSSNQSSSTYSVSHGSDGGISLVGRLPVCLVRAIGANDEE